MTMLAVFLALMAPFFAVHALLPQRKGPAISFGFFAIIILLYLFGIFGALEAGFLIVLALCFLCYAAGIAGIIRKRNFRDFARRFFSPAFCVWVLVFALVWFVDYGKMLHFYDEFTHWGDVVWVMCEYDQLASVAQQRSLFCTYPPAMALLQYFVQKIHLLFGGAVYREDLLYMAAQWFMLSLYLPFISRLSLRKPWNILLTAGALFMLPLFVFRSSAYALVYIDTFLSALSGFVLVYAFMCDRNDPLENATLLLALMTLVLTKDTGILFAFGGVLVYAAGCFANGGIRKTGRSAIAWCFGLAGAAALAWASWKIHLTVFDAAVAQASFRQPIELSELLAVVRGTSEFPWRREVLNKYINQFFIPIFYVWPSNVMVTHAFLILITGGGLAWLSNAFSKGSSAREKHFRWVCISWALMTIAYIAGMGILYLFKYNYEEAIILSAWNRYMDTIVAYGFFAFAAGCMLAMKERLLSRNAVIAVITLMLAFFPWAGALDTLSRSEVETSQAMQHNWVSLSQEIRAVSQADGLGEDAKVYLVYGEDTQPFLSMRYRLRPMQVNDESWMLGSYRSSPEDQEQVLSEEELRDRLTAGYDYLILCDDAETFAMRYSGLFEPGDRARTGGIYRIDQESGSLKLCN